MTSLVAHALGAVVTFAILRQSGDILGWLTWQVSSWFGKSGGMHFFSLGVSVDSRFGEVATRALIIAVPLLLLAGIAESIERMRRRVGPAALVLSVLIAASAGAAVWAIARPEDASLQEAWIVSMSFAILCVLWIVTYWSILAVTLRIFRRRALAAHAASAGITH